MTEVYQPFKDEYQMTGTGYPRRILEFDRPKKTVHPTQKPVELYQYLIKTYTNPGDTVLDPTCGSGTTGVACVQTGRHFVGVELDPKYYRVAMRRVAAAQKRSCRVIPLHKDNRGNDPKGKTIL